MRAGGCAALALMLLNGVALAGCSTLGGRTSEPAPTPALPSPPPAPPPPILHLPKPAPPPPTVPPRSCVPRGLVPAPRYPDTDAALRAAPGAADRYQLLAAGRILRQQRLEELERAIAACRQP